MRTFNYSAIKEQKWDLDVLGLIAAIYKEAGKQGFGPSGATRTPGLLIPNLSGILFPLVYSGFRRFLICFTYSLALLSPLFPGVPAPSVVIYVVKNASRPVSGEDSPVPDRKRFAFQIVCIVTLSRRLCKRFLQGCGSKVEPL